MKDVEDAKSGDVEKAAESLESNENFFQKAEEKIAALEAQSIAALEAEALASTINIEQVYFVVLYPTTSVLQARADREKMSAALMPEKLQEMIENFYSENSDNKTVSVNFKRLGATEAELDEDIENNPSRSQEGCIIPYQNIFADYSCDPDSATFEALSPFSEIINLKLTSEILEDFDECYYDYDSFVTYFILHDKATIEAFCLHWQFWSYPINEIRDYYGEQIGFYFAFTVHYTFWLVALVLLSLLIQYYVYVTGQATGITIAVYSTSIIVWASLLINDWGIQESKFALKWGTDLFISLSCPLFLYSSSITFSSFSRLLFLSTTFFFSYIYIYIYIYIHTYIYTYIHINKYAYFAFFLSYLSFIFLYLRNVSPCLM